MSFWSRCSAYIMGIKRKIAVIVALFILIQMSHLYYLCEQQLNQHKRQVRTTENVNIQRREDPKISTPNPMGSLAEPRSLISSNNSAGSTLLYSAVITNSSDSMAWDRVAVQGWAIGYTDKDRFSCCVKHSSGLVMQYFNVDTQPWVAHLNATIVAWQHRCHLERDNKDDLPSMVAVIPYGETCHHDFEEYIKAEFVFKYPKKIAVFAKVLYSGLSADNLLTWFEIHKTMGMDLVLVHVTESLNANARKVLNYYKQQGLAQVIHYPLPGKVEVMDEDTPECWNFKGVSAFDGLERLVGYEYVISMDPDEYLIPTKAETWRSVFVCLVHRLMEEVPTAAGYLFKTYIHITSWQPQQHSTFTIGQYINRSEPTDDRVKHVTIPRRLQPGGMRPHTFFPAYGFDGYTADVMDIAIYHFRECREIWTVEPENISCYTMTRIPDYTVYNHLKAVEPEIYRLKDILHI